MSVNFRTDAEHSSLKPAGPHLIERSSDSPAQSVSHAKITLRKPYTATVVTTIHAIRVKSQDSRVSQGE